MLVRCRSTVLTLMTSVEAISFEVAWGEEVKVVSAFVRSFDEVADQCVNGRGVQEGLAAHGRTAGVDDVVVGSGLEDVAGGAGLERLEEELLVLVHRQDQRSQLGSPT